MTIEKRVRLIAFYLPQFHPIPENDAWWGKGFTEWTNVAKSGPLFPGHYQPHIPADLGFYDLRLPETRQAQANLAREHGIYGFCYYHYWFHGKFLLERPFNEVIASGQPDFPFCLCWANEDWTRAWDGRSAEILIKQRYSEEDDREHLRWLSKAFRDERYIRVAGKPFFLVYRASRLPDPLKTTSIWREEAFKLGIGELFLCRVESFPNEHTNPEALGFDAAVEFQPDWTDLGPKLRNAAYGDYAVYEYSAVVEKMLQKDDPPYKRFPCVTPSWDNSPRRRRNAVILLNSTPALYEKWLRSTLQKLSQRSVDEKIVFINAWNEWGEGNHLEPDLIMGRGYLEATWHTLSSVIHDVAANIPPWADRDRQIDDLLASQAFKPHIGDLKVGQRLKVKGRSGEDGVFVALEIIVKAPAAEAVIKGLIQRIDHQKNTLRLFNRDFVLGDSRLKDLREVGLKAGDMVILRGKYLASKGFVLEKIKMKETTGFDLEELQGDINKIDQEKKTVELVGFTVVVNEKTKVRFSV
jgi:lipopolysaccharide biosynthesis protein